MSNIIHKSIISISTDKKINNKLSVDELFTQDVKNIILESIDNNLFENIDSDPKLSAVEVTLSIEPIE